MIRTSPMAVRVFPAVDVDGHGGLGLFDAADLHLGVQFVPEQGQQVFGFHVAFFFPRRSWAVLRLLRRARKSTRHDAGLILTVR